MAELYEGIGATLRELMGAKSFRVVMRDAGSGALSCRYLAGEATIPPGPRQLADTWTEQVLETGEPLLAPFSAEMAGHLPGAGWEYLSGPGRRPWAPWWCGRFRRPRPTGTGRRRS